MAFCGASVADPKHRRCSVPAPAGLEVRLAMHSLQPRFCNRGWPELHVRVNVNTGRVSVSSRRSEIHVAHAVMDDAAES
jgi:hypothetical protein